VCFRETDIVQGSLGFEKGFFVCPSRKEDTCGPAKNEASHRQSVTVNCQS
jgi:hypothetical protein